MEFLINQNVKFSSADNSLVGLNSEMELVILSRLCSELLCLLVKHNHHAISRETLLNELWEKRGLNASSNNLNNYISMLRRALAKFGHQELITTIPRYGFVFDADIEFIKIQKTIDYNILAPVELEKEAISNDTQNRPRNVFKYCNFLQITPLIIILFFLPELYRFSSLFMSREQVFRIGSCRVYLTDDITRRMETSLLEKRIKDIVNHEKVNCYIKTNIYFYAVHKVNAAGDIVVRQLLSYCPYNSKAPCENYYVSKQESANGNTDKK